MKHLLLVAFLIVSIMLSALLSSAQITITSENVPAAGTNFLKGIDNLATGIDPGTPGPGKVWDFSPLIANETIEYSYVYPIATPFPGYFPGANLALHSSDTAYSYLYYDTDIFEMQGLVMEYQGEEYAFDYSPDLIILNFPFTYGDQLEQDYFFEWIYANNEDSVKRRTHVTKMLEADAFGTVNMPVGTFDALRATVTQLTKDSLWAQVLGNWTLISVTVSSANYYDWYTNDPNVDISLASFRYDDTWSVLESAEFFMNSSVGIETDADKTEMNIYPNPSSDMLFIETTGFPGGILQIINITGETVIEQEMTSDKEQIDIREVIAGIYLCRIRDENSGGIYQEKIVIK